MKYAFIILATTLLISCNNQQSVVDDLQNQLESIKKDHTMAIDKYESISLMHTVYFWMKEDISDTETQHFEKWVRTLENCPTVSRFRMGKPADTEERNVIDNTYSYALNVEFTDLKAQNDYQVDPIHLKFIEECKDLWTKVIVYDNMIE